MNKYFFNEESSRILNELTQNPFGIGDDLWLYWLCTIELIPGGWHVRLYLENMNKKPIYLFSGWGLQDEAVTTAYNKIDQKWLQEGFKRGRILNAKYNVTCSPEKGNDDNDNKNKKS